MDHTEAQEHWPLPPAPMDCRAREILVKLGDKWSLYVVAHLGPEPLRFTELKRRVTGISQRMLTVTLRGLERDGIVTRTVHEVMPPRVDYGLTPLGETFLEATSQFIEWTEKNIHEIEAARQEYDRQHAGTADPQP